MPLRRRSASSQKKERIILIRLLRAFARLLEEKACFAIKSKEPAILEKPPLRRDLSCALGSLVAQSVRFAKRPLDPAAFVKHAVVANSCDIVRHFSRNFL
jgi:hypothetical protein